MYITAIMSLFMSDKQFNKNRVLMSIFLFMGLFGLFHWAQPAFAYDSQGNFRSFGIGQTDTTVVPIWLVVLIIAVISYLAVIYLCHRNK